MKETVVMQGDRWNQIYTRAIDLTSLLMDGDGEDRPIEIKDLVREILKSKKFLQLQKELKDRRVYFFNFYTNPINS